MYLLQTYFLTSQLKARVLNIEVVYYTGDFLLHEIIEVIDSVYLLSFYETITRRQQC